jgi:heptosyltransferase I
VTTPRRLGRGNRLLKRLDFAVGILGVLALAAVRRRRRRPAVVRRVAILKAAAIGDTVLLTPVITAISQAYPAATVSVYLGPSNQAVGGFLSGVEVRRYDPIRPFALVRRLRRERMDLVLDFEPWTRLNPLIAAAAGGWCAGFRSAGQHRHFAFDASVQHSRECHEIENYRRLARLIGVAATRDPSFACTAANPAADARPYVVLHAWSGGFMGHLKEWPRERWVELGRRLLARGAGVVITAGPADRERALDLAEGVGAGSRALLGASLPETATALRDAIGVVSVNTGVLHLAAAVGARTCALNGPVPARRWGALGSRATNVDPQEPGCGYLHLGFEFDGQRWDCMELISVEQVWAAVQPWFAPKPGSEEAATLVPNGRSGD